VRGIAGAFLSVLSVPRLNCRRAPVALNPPPRALDDHEPLPLAAPAEPWNDAAVAPRRFIRARQCAANYWKYGPCVCRPRLSGAMNHGRHIIRGKGGVTGTFLVTFDSIGARCVLVTFEYDPAYWKCGLAAQSFVLRRFHIVAARTSARQKWARRLTRTAGVWVIPQTTIAA
jgi:hypothetical protein